MSGDNENAAIYFVDRHLAEGRGGKTAFICGDDNLTYGDLAAQSDRMSGLYADLGVGREARAAMIVLDCLDFPVIFWGSLKAGVIPVALNTLLTTEQYRYILADCRARVLFLSSALYEVVAPALDAAPDLEHVLIIGDEIEGRTSFSTALTAAEPSPAVAASADETAFWLYSSGSTGSPKGVRHVHGALKVTADTYGAQVLGIRAEDTIFSAAKLFFAYGLGNGMTFPMAVGATTVLLPTRPTPEVVSGVLDATRPSIFCGVPTLFAAMLAGEIRGTDNLRISISAGEALPRDVGERWKGATGSDILDGVGSTEMLHIFLSNNLDNLEYGTSGVPVPGYEARLVDENGAEVGNDEIGELLIAGGSAAEGYWNQREKSRATFEGVWTRTGDKYLRRADGRYVYCGRTDDMFKVSGQWVSPFEVESALIAHPDVLEAAVVPAEDAEGLLKPKAFVVLKTGGAAADMVETLQSHVKAAVGPWKYPRWIEFADDLPKTATGKIQRFRLREG